MLSLASFLLNVKATRDVLFKLNCCEMLEFFGSSNATQMQWAH